MIYFIQDSATGFIKIGVASDPWNRLRNLQTGCPGEIVMRAIDEGGADDEAALHLRFAEYRERGEWFRPGALLTDHIATLPSPVPKPQRATRSVAFWGAVSDAHITRETGISNAMLCQIRNGERRPSPETAITLQRVTGRSAVELVFGALASEAF